MVVVLVVDVDQTVHLQVHDQVHDYVPGWSFAGLEIVGIHWQRPVRDGRAVPGDGVQEPHWHDSGFDQRRRER